MESNGSRVVGRSMTRREDPRLLTGKGRYVADVVLPGMLHAVFVRSPVARGRIRDLDRADALAVDGVVAVFTGADLNRVAGSYRPTPLLDQRGFSPLPLAEDRVSFVGEPVALVVADSQAVAEDAAELVRLGIDAEPPVTDLDQAARDELLVHPELGTNLCAQMRFPMRPKLRQALEEAAFVFASPFSQQRHANAPLETRGILASYDALSGELQAWLSTQNPHEARLALARVTGVPEHRVRVVAGDVGGGFGQKFWAPRDELTVALAARQLGRAVRWIESRRENLTASTHARRDVGSCQIALDGDLRFAGTYLDHLEDAGSFPTGVIGGAGPFVGMMFTGPYRVPMHAFTFRSVMTSTCPRGAYRGPWTFATTAREQLVDRCAHAIGVDPLELRRRNVIQRHELPYTMATRLELDNVSPAETLEQAADLIGYDDFRAHQRREFERRGALLGIGIALYIEPLSGGTLDPLGSDTAIVRVSPSGVVTVCLGTGAHGQGVETTMGQIVAEELGVDFDNVDVVQGDTGSTPYGRGTGASGTAVIAGGACRAACDQIRAKAIRIGAHVLGVSAGEVRFRAGGVEVVAGPGPRVTWAEIARIAYHETRRLPPGEAPGLESTETFKAPPVTWSNACHMCTVEVDPATGGVAVLRYAVSDDCGVMINPMIVDGQIAGGVAQGIGSALFETVEYRPDGHPAVDRLGDYHLPRAAEVPVVEIRHVETPSTTPGGHKGMGQGGAVGSPPCVFNAVQDALALVGAATYRTPIRRGDILDALAGRGRRLPAARGVTKLDADVLR